MFLVLVFLPFPPFSSLGCSAKQSLKVREHQTLGPYVEGLLKLAVTSFNVSGRALKVGSDIIQCKWKALKTVSNILWYECRGS